MLVLLSLLAADPTLGIKLASTPVLESEGSPAPPRSPYRLDPNIAGPADGKAAAVRTTGSRCQITGPTLCRKKQRTLFSSSY